MSETSTTEVLATIIAKHYDLGDVQLPQTLAAAHQRRHLKLIVDTSKGRFLAKTYKRDPEILDNLRFQHRLSAFLEQHDLPVAHIQEARNGKKIVELKSWALELQTFIPGDAMKITSKTLPVASKALGKFHHVCRDFPVPERDARKWRFSEVPREMFSELYSQAQELGGSSELDSHCNGIALFLREATNELSWDALDTFETGLIHGDWHSGNLIFQGNALGAIIDLEFAGDGCYLEDLSYAVSNLCIRTAIEEERLTQRTDMLLHHYQQFRTLSPSEERALYFAVGIKHIATVCFQIKQLGGKVAGFDATEWIERLAIQTQWLADRAFRIQQGLF
jgi:Ser/Thr protein kinase RdoA (MazF antagonist)